MHLEADASAFGTGAGAQVTCRWGGHPAALYPHTVLACLSPTRASFGISGALGWACSCLSAAWRRDHAAATHVGNVGYSFRGWGNVAISNRSIPLCAHIRKHLHRFTATAHGQRCGAGVAGAVSQVGRLQACIDTCRSVRRSNMMVHLHRPSSVFPR